MGLDSLAMVHTLLRPSPNPSTYVETYCANRALAILDILRSADRQNHWQIYLPLAQILLRGKVVVALAITQEVKLQRTNFGVRVFVLSSDAEVIWCSCAVVGSIGERRSPFVPDERLQDAADPKHDP